MKKLSVPDSTKAVSLLNGVIERKRKSEYVERLTANKRYIVKRYKVYEQEKNALENLNPSIIVSKEDKEAIHSSFNKSFKDKIRNGILERVYEDCRGICPYCGEGKIEEVDHYVPKEEYPEFTLYPNNLIPSCNKCNGKKLDGFINSTNERQFINFYYDNIDDIEFLRIEFYFDSMDIKKTTKVKYMADFSKISNEYLRKIVQKHYSHLDLLLRYDEVASNEISEIFDTLQDQPCRDESYVKTLAEGIILARRNGQLKRAGKNDWKYLLYDKLVVVGYIDELVKYVCNEVVEENNS